MKTLTDAKDRIWYLEELLKRAYPILNETCRYTTEGDEIVSQNPSAALRMAINAYFHDHYFKVQLP